MGSCFSVAPSFSPAASGTGGRPPTIKVIKTSGLLMEYSQPIRVRQVLLPAQYPSSFLCDTDELSYGGHIRALHSNHLLSPGNIYLLLPRSSLNKPLTADDMAVLASHANTALSGKAARMDAKQQMIRCSGGRIDYSRGIRIPLVMAEEFDVTAGDMAVLASRANTALSGKADRMDAKKQMTCCSGGRIDCWRGIRIPLVMAEEFDACERINKHCVVGRAVTKVPSHKVIAEEVLHERKFEIF